MPGLDHWSQVEELAEPFGPHRRSVARGTLEACDQSDELVAPGWIVGGLARCEPTEGRDRFVAPALLESVAHLLEEFDGFGGVERRVTAGCVARVQAPIRAPGAAAWP